MNAQPMLSFLSSWESEVGDLKIIILVEQNVLWLEVSVYNAGSIMDVLDWTQQLFEVITREGFVEATFDVLYFDVWE